ncbi:MAG TPA: hypothetical protein VMF69_08755 [Gemmataceae bacterium]|nr:hypothetical protein [Gemmataceae bacterium]
MSRRLGIVCAAALLFVVLGCSASSLLLSRTGSGGKRQVVAGSVNDVAARLKATLNKANIIVAVYPADEDTVKLNGQTKPGQRFSLVLKRQATNHGENTVVTIEWENDADEDFWPLVVNLLAQPADGINTGR